jgi:hypothetical protein
MPKRIYEPHLPLVQIELDMLDDPGVLRFQFSPILEQYLEPPERNQLGVAFQSVSRILISHLKRVAGEGSIQPEAITGVLECAYSEHVEA